MPPAKESDPVPVSDPGSPAPPCPCASRSLPSEIADPAPIPAVSTTWEAEPPLDDGKEIDSAVIGEAAAAAASAAAGAGADAAAVAACKADAAVPVASEPSASARFIRALPVRELLTGGAFPAPAALAAGGACSTGGEDVRESARPLPEATAGVPAEAAPLMTGADSEFMGAAVAGAGAASDCDFEDTAAVLAAGGALVDGGVADAGVELAGTAPAAIELTSVIEGPKTAPCTACVVSSAGVAEPALELTATGEEPAAPPATGGVESPEPLSPTSSRVEGRTGAPLAGGRSGGSESAPVGAATGATAAGGAPLPDCGNASPPDLPLAGLAESSFRLGLAEARSSARAKSRGPPAL